MAQMDCQGVLFKPGYKGFLDDGMLLTLSTDSALFTLVCSEFRNLGGTPAGSIFFFPERVDGGTTPPDFRSFRK